MHATSEHRGRNWKNKSAQTPASPAPDPEAGLMGIITESPVEVDFG